MKAKVEYGLEGAFKMDLYSGGKLVESTDWFSNFITASGLLYPTIYNFVDCFRFLSLGTSSANNDGGSLGTPTTGLLGAIGTFNTSAGLQSGTFIGWQGYSTGTSTSSSPCITVSDVSGPRFFRAWNIPTGDFTVTVNQPGGFLGINEIAVSPSSGTDPKGACAFSRIIRPLSIPNGFKAVISYQLSVNVANTGTTIFNSGTFLTGNADIDNDPDLIAGWNQLSGYYRQVFHGLECIDTQGAAYITKYGNGMEPSLQNLGPYVFYLSPDNSQFDVCTSGGAQVSESAAYAADGLMLYLSNINLTATRTFPTDPTQINNFYYGTPDQFSNVPPNITPTNIRLGDASAGVNFPAIDNYSVGNTELPAGLTYQSNQSVTGFNISYATPGAIGYNFGRSANLGQQAVFSTHVYALPFNSGGQNAPTGRKKTVTRKTFFPPGLSMGFNTRFGSLVFAYQSPTSQAAPYALYYPLVDTLFFDSSGRSMMQHYRFINNIYLTERGSGVADAFATLVYPSNSQSSIRFSGLQTFQGPFVGPTGIDPAAPAMNQITNGGNRIGIPASGNYKPVTQGSSTASYGGGSGWGMVYGVTTTDVYWSAPPDQGLADHSLSVRTSPGQTGKVYWPYVLANQNIILTFTGVKFSGSGVGFINDSGAWFQNNHQMVQFLTFTDRVSGNGPQLDASFSGDPSVFTSSPIAANSTESGFYITTGRYNYYSLQAADSNAFITANSGFLITGYLDPLAPSNMGAPAATTNLNQCFMVPLYTGTNTTNLSVGSFSVASAVRLTGFFNSPTDRAYNNTAWNNGLGYQGGTNYPFFVTGYATFRPLYMTYVFRSGALLIAHSYFQTNDVPTNFVTPSGYPNTSEALVATGWRLLPNQGGATNNLAVNSYPPVIGGQYPALSFDNGLELYFDINWSAPCPPVGVVNCLPPQ